MSCEGAWERKVTKLDCGGYELAYWLLGGKESVLRVFATREAAEACDALISEVEKQMAENVGAPEGTGGEWIEDMFNTRLLELVDACVKEGNVIPGAPW